MLYPAGSGTRAMPSEPAPVLNHPPRLSSLRIIRSARFAEARSVVITVSLWTGSLGNFFEDAGGWILRRFGSNMRAHFSSC